MVTAEPLSRAQAGYGEAFRDLTEWTGGSYRCTVTGCSDLPESHQGTPAFWSRPISRLRPQRTAATYPRSGGNSPSRSSLTSSAATDTKCDKPTHRKG